MKKALGYATTALVITLTVIVGMRMSMETRTVMIGVACALVACIPTFLIVAVFTDVPKGSREPSGDSTHDEPARG